MANKPTTLYRILIPVMQNGGVLNYESERKQFASELAIISGGYTEHVPSKGIWIDPTTGKRYSEPMIAFDFVATKTALGTVVHRAFQLFPDQISFFTAQIGVASIVSRV